MMGYQPDKLLLLLLACICFFGQAAAQAQSPAYRTRVVLNNQQVLRGYMSQPWHGGTLSLQLSERTSVEIDAADIRKVKQRNADKDRAYENLRKTRHAGEYGNMRGFYQHVFAGPSFGERDLNLGFGLVNGIRLDKHFALGLGVNYDRFAQAAALPIYLQGRAYLKNDGVSLYSFAEAGYGPAWQNKNNNSPLETIKTRGGLVGQAGLGYQFNYAKSALIFSLGYKLQKMNTLYEFYQYQYTGVDGWDQPTLVKYMDVDERRLIRRVVLTIGISL